MKKILISLSLITSLFLVSFNLAYAQPQINSVSGNISDGEVITVSGVGFGENGPTIFHYNNFEQGENDDLISTDSPVTLGAKYSVFTNNINLGYKHTYFTNSVSLSGNMAMQSDLSGGAGWNSFFNLEEGVEHIFISFWIYVPVGTVFPGASNNPPNNNWKFFTLWNTPTNAGPNWTWAEPSSAGSNSAMWRRGPGDPTGVYRHDCYFREDTVGEWFRMHIWVDPSGVDHWEIYPGAIYDFYGKQFGPGVVLRLNRDDLYNGRTLEADMLPGDEKWNYIKFPHYARQDSNSFPTYDDIYIAIGEHAQARIEIGNNPVYENSTNLAISTVDDWVDDEINVTIRQGSFELGDNAYLFVIDADGNPSDGYPIVLGSDSFGATPPSAPQGLSVS